MITLSNEEQSEAEKLEQLNLSSIISAQIESTERESLSKKLNSGNKWDFKSGLKDSEYAENLNKILSWSNSFY